MYRRFGFQYICNLIWHRRGVKCLFRAPTSTPCLSDLHNMIMRTEAFEGCAVEFLLVVRMGDADQ